MKKTLDIIAEELLIMINNGSNNPEVQVTEDVFAYAEVVFAEDLGETYTELVSVDVYDKNDDIYENISEYIFNKLYKEIDNTDYIHAQRVYDYN